MSDPFLEPRGPARIALASFRRRRLVLLVWPLVLVALFAVSNTIGGDFRQNFGLPGSETEATADRLADAGFEVSGGAEGQIVIAPATMRLLGERNWWLPAWLDRLLPDAHVEDRHAEPVRADV